MATAGKKRNGFAIGVSVAVVVLIGLVIGVVVWMNNAATAPGAAPQASNIDQKTGAITFGDGPDTVGTYVDFMCPVCAQFEQTEGETVKQLVDEGAITLELHPVAILDRSSQGSEFSSRAAAAMYAVAEADPDNAYAFLEAMYQNQPEENTPGLTDEQIIQIAKDAGVDVTATLESTITDGTYVEFAQQQKLPDGSRGTPSLTINGELVPVTMDPQKDIVANLGE